MRTEVEEPSIGEKLLLAGLETCDKVGEERITLACRWRHQNKDDNDDSSGDENIKSGKFRLTAHNQLGILWCQRDDMIKVEASWSIHSFHFKTGASTSWKGIEHLLQLSTSCKPARSSSPPPAPFPRRLIGRSREEGGGSWRARWAIGYSHLLLSCPGRALIHHGLFVSVSYSLMYSVKCVFLPTVKYPKS